MELSTEIFGDEIMDLIYLIYCTQVHLYERCTELVGLPDFKANKRKLDRVIHTSAGIVKSIELCCGPLATGRSKTCELLICYLEEIFAPNYEKSTTARRQLQMNHYLLNIHHNGLVADTMIRSLISANDRSADADYTAIDELLNSVNLNRPALTI